MKTARVQSAFVVLLLLITFPACTDRFVPVILDVESVTFFPVLNADNDYSVEAKVILGNSCFSFVEMVSEQSDKTMELTSWGVEDVGGTCRETYTIHSEIIPLQYSGAGQYKVIINLPDGSQMVVSKVLP